MSAPYQKHSKTSKAAAKAIEARMTYQQLALLKLMLRHGDRGVAGHRDFTDNALIELTLYEGSMSLNSVRPRRIELLRLGLIEAVGEDVGASGRKSTLWRITEAGRQAVRDLGA